MDNPAQDVPRVVRELCEPVDANEMTAAVDKYFAEDAVFVCESPGIPFPRSDVSRGGEGRELGGPEECNAREEARDPDHSDGCKGTYPNAGVKKGSQGQGN